MRVAAAVLTILISFSATAFAQGLSVGVKGGAGWTNVTFDPDAGTTARWSPVAGVFATLPPLWGVSLQPEVLYAVKAARLPGDGAPTTLRLEYLEIPVLARVSMNAFGRRVYLAAGPSFGVRLRARTRTEFSGVTEEIDVADGLQRFDLGLSAGGGVEFGALVVDARYTHGLSDIDKDTTDDVKAHNRSVSLTAGWRF